jgi:hypothetical protein
MEQTWKPTTAGILSIIAGALSVIVGIAIAALGGIAHFALEAFGLPLIGTFFASVMAIPIILGIVAIVGGIYALRRRVWGLALAGAICALIAPPPGILGILAIIFVSLGKREFT